TAFLAQIIADETEGVARLIIVYECFLRQPIARHTAQAGPRMRGRNEHPQLILKQRLEGEIAGFFRLDHEGEIDGVAAEQFQLTVVISGLDGDDALRETLPELA